MDHKKNVFLRSMLSLYCNYMTKLSSGWIRHLFKAPLNNSSASIIQRGRTGFQPGLYEMSENFHIRFAELNLPARLV